MDGRTLTQAPQVIPSILSSHRSPFDSGLGPTSLCSTELLPVKASSSPVSWKALVAEEAFDHIAVKAADRGVFIDSMASNRI